MCARPCAGYLGAPRRQAHVANRVSRESRGVHAVGSQVTNSWASTWSQSAFVPLDGPRYALLRSQEHKDFHDPSSITRHTPHAVVFAAAAHCSRRTAALRSNQVRGLFRDLRMCRFRHSAPCRNRFLPWFARSRDRAQGHAVTAALAQHRIANDVPRLPAASQGVAHRPDRVPVAGGVRPRRLLSGERSLGLCAAWQTAGPAVSLRDTQAAARRVRHRSHPHTDLPPACARLTRRCTAPCARRCGCPLPSRLSAWRGPTLA